MAPPCENPARMILCGSMPAASCSSSSASIAATEAAMPSASWLRSMSTPKISCQARMGRPPLIVPGRTGACGKIKRTARAEAAESCGTIGSKSWPSAPSPCSHTTACLGLRPVSTTTCSIIDFPEFMVRPSLTALAFILLVSAAPVLSGCGQKGALYLPQPEAAPADAEEDHDSESDDSGQSADTIQNARTVMVSGAQHGTVVNLNLHALAPGLDGTARGFAT